MTQADELLPCPAKYQCPDCGHKQKMAGDLERDSWVTCCDCEYSGRFDEFKRCVAAKKLTDNEIVQSALFHGFSLSTTYGQEPGKLMPITDSGTLLKFAREIIRMSTRTPHPDTAAVKAAQRAIDHLSSFEPVYQEGLGIELTFRSEEIFGELMAEHYEIIGIALRAIAKGDGG